MKLSQIVITKVEEPVDTPRGEVFKVSLFDSKECIDNFYCNENEDVVIAIKAYLWDLISL